MNQLITQSTINFTELVQNSNTTVSLGIQSKIIELLNTEFTEEQQKWYVANLWMYMNYHPTNDFPINLETVFKMIGFANKGNAKRTLENNFTVNEDYKVVILPRENNLFIIQKDKNLGGRPDETIMLNIDTFKGLCMITKTNKGKEIRKYYVKLENIYNRIIKEEIEEQASQHKIELQKKDEELLNKDNLKEIEKHEFLIEKFKNKKCVYLAKVVKNNENIIKVGSSGNIKERIHNLRDVFGHCIFIDVFEHEYFREIEQNILHDLNEYKYKEKINNHLSKEVVKITHLFTYNHLLNIIKKSIENYVFLSSKELLDVKKLKIVERLLDLGAPLSDISDLVNTQTIQLLPNEPIEKVIKEDILIKRGRKIQKIDPYNFTLIKVYDSMITLLREYSDEKYVKHCLDKAIKANTLYKNFRWAFVELNADPNIVIIEPTVSSISPRHDSIIQINNEKTEIIDSFTNIRKLASILKIGHTKLSNIINENLLHNNSYYIRMSKCPEELLNNCEMEIKYPTSSKAKKIQRINISTNEIEIYNSLTEMTLKCGLGDKAINNAIKNNTNYKGYAWSYA